MPTILKTSVIGYNIGLQKDCKISLRYDQFCKNSFLKIPNLKQSKLFVSINCLKNRNMSNIILSMTLHVTLLNLIMYRKIFSYLLLISTNKVQHFKINSQGNIRRYPKK